MPDHDRTALFVVGEQLQAAVAAIASQALDAPATCAHLAAPLIFGAEPERGAWCTACGTEPMARLLLDPLCTVCRARPADPGLLQIGVQEHDVLLRACTPCRTGNPPANPPTGDPMTTTTSATTASLGSQPPITPGSPPCDLCGFPSHSNGNYGGLGMLCHSCRPKLSHPGIRRTWDGIALLAALKINVGTNPDALHDLEAAAVECGVSAWRDAGLDTPPADRFGWLDPAVLDHARAAYFARYEQRRIESGKVEARWRQAQRESHAADVAAKMYR